MNSGPLSDRMNSGAPCCAVADCTSRRTSVEPIWRSGRIEAVLRRSRTQGMSDSGPEDKLRPFFRLGAAEIDRRKFTVTVEGKPVSLTARELRLAEVLAARPGEVLTRDALLNLVWGVNYFGTTRTLDQHVAQLRKKIASGTAPNPIATVHGVGYRYDG